MIWKKDENREGKESNESGGLNIKRHQPQKPSFRERSKDYSNSSGKFRKSTSESSSGRFNKAPTESRSFDKTMSKTKFIPKSNVDKKAGKATVELMPLGGLEEIGKNCMVIKYGDEMVLVDVGISFPDGSMPGIDVVSPDFTYVNRNAKNLKAIILTHGHEDHIGAISHFFRTFPNKDVPIYGSGFTIGLVKGKLSEHWGKKKYNTNIVKGRDRVRVSSNIEVEFVSITHSIPQAFCVAIHTPIGTIVHTGDYKFDLTPINNNYTDFYSLAALGEKGVLLLLSDSTNSPKEEFTPSEKMVKKSFANVLRKAPGRIIIASFSSHAHRVQHLVEMAHEFGRKTALDGRSMMKCSEVGLETEEVIFPKGSLVPISKLNTMPANKAMVICTGTQGEEMSALTRISKGMHKDVKIKPEDTVIISATFIPGNERAIIDVINNLMKRGAEVIYEKHHGMHVSGHGARGDIKLMLNLIRPKYFMPVHGEFLNLKRNKELAIDFGLEADNVVLTKNGDRVVVTDKEIAVRGKVESGVVLIESSNTGGVEDITLNERKLMAGEGIVAIHAIFDGKKKMITYAPEITSKGVSLRRGDPLMGDLAKAILEEFAAPMDVVEPHVLKKAIRDKAMPILRKSQRNPMVIPIITIV